MFHSEIPFEWLYIGIDINTRTPVAEKYIPLHLDEDTRAFLEECEESTLSMTSVYAKPLVEVFIAPLLSRTSVNGCVRSLGARRMSEVVGHRLAGERIALSSSRLGQSRNTILV